MEKVKFVPPNKIFPSDDQVAFIKMNFAIMTDAELAAGTGLTASYIGNFGRKIGLKRYRLINWTADQTRFLIDNYKQIGNKELAMMINRDFPSAKYFQKHTIVKKMDLLGLVRTSREVDAIVERNRLNGVWGTPQKFSVPVDRQQVFVTINSKTRIALRPGMSLEQLQEKYRHLNR